MSYHREHSKKWAGLVGQAVPAVTTALNLYDEVEQATRPYLPCQQGGHPTMPPGPRQFPGPPASAWRAADVFNRVSQILMIPVAAADLVGRMGAPGAVLCRACRAFPIITGREVENHHEVGDYLREVTAVSPW